MPETLAREAHGRLWAKIEGENIVLQVHRRMGEDPELTGWFHPNYAGAQVIRLIRNVRVDQVDDYEHELVTLAHEYGHAISHRRGERPSNMPDPSPNLKPSEKRNILKEEAHAWRYGRQVMVDLGVRALETFDNRRKSGLLNRRLLLGLE